MESVEETGKVIKNIEMDTRRYRFVRIYYTKDKKYFIDFEIYQRPKSKTFGAQPACHKAFNDVTNRTEKLLIAELQREVDECFDEVDEELRERSIKCYSRQKAYHSFLRCQEDEERKAYYSKEELRELKSLCHLGGELDRNGLRIEFCRYVDEFIREESYKRCDLIDYFEDLYRDVPSNDFKKIYKSLSEIDSDFLNGFINSYIYWYQTYHPEKNNLVYDGSNFAYYLSGYWKMIDNKEKLISKMYYNNLNYYI